MQQQRSARRARLLVVDADSAARSALKRPLDTAGYVVHLASDTGEALAATRDWQPDVVICDQRLPHVDGLEFCRQIKSDPMLRPTYVAMVTEPGDAAEKVRGLDAGADDVLVKPISDDELLARVRAGLRIRQFQQESAQAQRRSTLVEMAATLGHEINNPLTGLFGHLELLLQYLEAGDRDRMLHHIRRAGELASRIADVAQSLSSLEDPQTKIYREPIRMLDLEEIDSKQRDRQPARVRKD